MSWVAAGVAGGAVISGAISSNAAGKAADAQTGAANRSIDAQRTQDSLTRMDNAPFLKTGTAANQRLAMLLGLGDPSGISKPTRDDAAAEVLKQHIAKFGTGYTDQSDMNAVQQQTDSVLNRMNQEYNQKVSAAPSADPSYGSLTNKFTSADLAADPVYNSGLQFGLDEGTKGINARALQSGGYDSGATLKALTRFGNDYGSTKANESYNRFTNDQNNIFNRLSGVSGSGQVATGQIAASGVNATNNISNDLTGAGNARAAGIVGGANAWGGAASGINGALNGYQNNQILQQLLKRNGSSTPVYTPTDYGE